jgi:hypothetical protein
MSVALRRLLTPAAYCFLLSAVFMAPAFSQDISASPSSLSFANTYVGKASGSQVITINYLLTKGNVIIESIGFEDSTGANCPGYGIASGVAPFTLNTGQTLTHYSIFFQPSAAQSYNCNFVLTLGDGTFLDVPLSGTGLTSTAAASVSTTALNFPNQSIGTTSAAQTVTITNTGTGSLTLTAINLSPASFTTNAVTLPSTINAGNKLTLSVFYTPSQVTSATGALDLQYTQIPDNGVTLTGNSVAATTLDISTSPTLPQATQSSAYEATLATSGGVGPYTWALANGSTLPSGLTLSSAGVISGTLASTVKAGGYQFTVQATDSSNGATASSTLTLGVLAYLGDNCNDLSFDVPNTTTPIVALNDLGSGTYQGSEGGLYPSGSNVRPPAQDAYGVNLAYGIQPLDASGNPSPTGKYVLLAVGESTLENEFNRFLPIANADPAKNPNLVIVNGAQGGATPNEFTSTTSSYWATTFNNYLPQNGVTANQVVAAIVEDTDGIATGSFPSDIADLQSQYETMMQTMLTLFPNLKMVYFSSRVYGGYSNGVGSPDNPEPYAFEVGFAVKWAIQDQLDGNSNLNYNPLLGPVVAPWMSWGTYYWSNGMLGRSDGLVWDCADFSADGTHPSSTYGQLKVATALLTFLKTDDTTIPWYLVPKLALTATAGNNQTGNVGTVLPTSLSVLASNLNGGAPMAGVSVAFSDGGAGGTFGTPTATTGSNGAASTTYTLPATAQTVTITASSSGYPSATFTETAAVLALAATAGNNQSGAAGTVLPTALTVLATSNGNPVAGASVTFSDGGAGGTFGSPTAITGSNGTASTTYTLPATAQTITILASSSGYSSASFTETATVLTLAATGGNNQTGSVGGLLPTALTVTATNNGSPVQGVSVTFSDGGAGGSFGSPTAITASNGTASTTYTLPATAQTVTISATSAGYTPASFTETATVPIILALTPTAGNNQTGGTGTTLPTALAVVATSNGTRVPGVSVTFSDGDAGGTFGTPVATTDANGNASSTYTLPATAQTVTVTASSSGYTSATFTETADVQALSATAGNNQIGSLGTTLPTALNVVAMSNGSPAPGVSVMFSDGGAGGTFGTPVATTDANGNASTTYTLPATAQTVTVTASSSGYTSAIFTETSAVCALTATTGNSQSGMAGTVLPTALSVLAACSGTPISGVSVTFSDGGAGGSFGTGVAVTGTNGIASTTYTLPPTSETVTITAASPGYTSATFTETSTPLITSLSLISGGKQTGAVGTTLPLPLVVRAKNSSGKVVSGAPITFADGGIGGTFSPNPAITGSNGEASTTFTLPTVVKSFTVTASDGSVSVNITEKTVVGPPTSFTIVSGNNQSANPKTKLSKNLVVSVKDEYGNPIEGVTVTFTDNGAGGTFSTTTPVTTVTGQASVTYTTGPNAGTVTISASTSTLGPLNFTETVK